MNSIRKPFFGWLASLLIAGFFIFDHLGLRAFWLDEAGVANLLPLSFSQLARHAVVDGSPLLYIYLLKIWSLFFGEAEWTLRCFSALSGLACVALLYPVGREMFGDARTGAWASFLGSTSYFLIFFGTQNKVYTFAALAGLLSLFFFFRLARRGRVSDGWSYWAAASASLYLHPWLFLVFAGQILVAAVFRAECLNVKRIAAVQAAVILMAAPNIGVTLFQGSLNANAWMEKPTVWTVAQSLGHMSYGQVWVYAVAGAVAVFFWRLPNHSVRRPATDAGFSVKLLLVSILFPLFAACAISQFSPAYVPQRYEMNLLPAWLLLLSYFWAPLRRFWIVSAVLAASLIGAAYGQVAGERRMIEGYQSTDKTVVQGLLTRLQDGDLVVATDLSYSTVTYYFRRLNTGASAKKVEIFAYPEEIAAHPSWKNLSEMMRDQPRYRQEAARLAQLLKERSRGGRTVWVFDHSTNPINAFLRQELSQAFLLNSEEIPPSPREASWFDKILIFRH